MTTVESALLILLSVGFLVLVVLAIIIALTVLKILQTVRRISLKAETATESLNDTLRLIGKKVAPMATSSVVGMVLRKVTKHKKGGSHE